MAVCFVADVGGTNIRLAQPQGDQLKGIIKYQCEDFDSIGEAILAYFAEFPDLTFNTGCIAIACPVRGDQIKMTNHSWQFSTRELQALLGLEQLHVINDFTSVAFCLPLLSEQQKVQIGGGKVVQSANIAVFGPGTGLGVEHLTWTGSQWQALDGEGGHVDFAPVDDNDLVIWHYLRATQGRASAEELMSGRGLVNIYRAFCQHAGVAPTFGDAAHISDAALMGRCDISAQTLAQFCRVLGSFAGNLALNLATAGGVYIGGGIVPRFVDYLHHSDFRQRFEQKGRFTDYVQSIPTFVITEPDHGLLGAAAYLQQHAKTP